MDMTLLFKSEGLSAIVIASAPLRIPDAMLIAIDCFMGICRSPGIKNPTDKLNKLKHNTAIPACCQ